tara:strand:- start:972 stop:1445 length:474 start_codon:yes stop_codon:yes gene_type:complete
MAGEESLESKQRSVRIKGMIRNVLIGALTIVTAAAAGALVKTLWSMNSRVAVLETSLESAISGNAAQWAQIQRLGSGKEEKLAELRVVTGIQKYVILPFIVGKHVDSKDSGKIKLDPELKNALIELRDVKSKDLQPMPDFRQEKIQEYKRGQEQMKK